jgi:hypothetical protein
MRRNIDAASYEETAMLSENLKSQYEDDDDDEEGLGLDLENEMSKFYKTDDGDTGNLQHESKDENEDFDFEKYVTENKLMSLEDFQ